MKKENCAGCHNNVYNHGLYGAEECWSFKDAKLVWRKEVPIDQRPPWTQEARQFPNCYKKPGYVYVNPKTVR